MKISNRTKRGLIILVFISVIVCFYNFINLVSSGTHGSIEEFPFDKSKIQIKYKVDSLIRQNDRIQFVANDYTNYYDIRDTCTGVVFTYKIMDLGESASSIVLIYIKNGPEEKFKTKNELKIFEKNNFVALFQNLIIHPINEDN